MLHGSNRSQDEEGFVPDHAEGAQTSNPELRTALQSLLRADLSDQELRARLQALVDAPQGTLTQPTTDDATEHPGYQ